MPTYDFECEQCAYYAEISQSVHEPSVLKCPVCDEQTLRKVYINPPAMFVRGEAKSIGQLADKNARNMGFYEKQDRAIKDGVDQAINNEKNEKRKLHQKITSMTPEQKLKWIKEGD